MNTIRATALSGLCALFAVSLYGQTNFSLSFDDQSLGTQFALGSPSNRTLPIAARFGEGHESPWALQKTAEMGPIYALAGNLSLREGAASFWFRLQKSVPGKRLRLFHVYAQGATQKKHFAVLSLFRGAADNSLTGQWHLVNETATNDVEARIPANAVVEGTWHKIDFCWSASGLSLSLNGVLAQQTEIPAASLALLSEAFTGQCYLFPAFSAGEDKESDVLLDTFVLRGKSLSSRDIASHFILEGGKAALGMGKPVAPAPAVRRSGPLSVKDFGAKGDGKTDDTDAIQRCLLEAGSARYQGFYRGHVAAPEVFFPMGEYRVSRTLLVPPCGGRENGGSFINLRGEGAVIRQTNPACDLFYFRLAYRNLVEGLTFIGGNRQLKIWSKNRDKAHLTIRDCVFRGSAAAAIDDQLRVRLDPVRKVDWGADIMEPYKIATNAEGLPILTPLDETQWTIASYVSTLMHVGRCRFEACAQALSSWADWALMDDCVIETRPGMEGPVILVGGTLLLENVEGLAHDDPTKNAWWITLDPRRTRSYGNASLDLRKVTLRTDSASGWTVVRNEAKWNRDVKPSIFAEDCAFQGNAGKARALFDLVEIPNQVALRGCRETSGRPCALAGLGREFPADYFSNADAQWFSFSLEEGNAGFRPSTPGVLAPFASPPLPPQIAARFDFGVQPATLRELRLATTRSLFLGNFGPRGDGSADDTAAFRAALQEASKSDEQVELVIPNGIYRLDEGIVLPPRVALRGSGYVGITVPKGRKGPVFTATEPKGVLLQNLHFVKCEQALLVRAAAGQSPKVLIDSCTFNEVSDFALRLELGNGNPGEPGAAQVRVSDCTFEYARALWHNFPSALVEHCWVTTDPDMGAAGVVENRGRLHLKSLCGVPQTTRHDKSGGKDDTDTKSADLRWFNNAAQLLIDRCRFGSEDGGLPVVVNLAPAAVLLAENSWLNMRKNAPGNPARNTFFDCESLPQLLALRGCWGFPTTLLTVPKGARAALEGKFFGSGNLLASWIEEKQSLDLAARVAPLRQGGLAVKVSTEGAARPYLLIENDADRIALDPIGGGRIFQWKHAGAEWVHEDPSLGLAVDGFWWPHKTAGLVKSPYEVESAEIEGGALTIRLRQAIRALDGSGMEGAVLFKTFRIQGRSGALSFSTEISNATARVLVFSFRYHNLLAPLALRDSRGGSAVMNAGQGLLTEARNFQARLYRAAPKLDPILDGAYKMDALVPIEGGLARFRAPWLPAELVAAPENPDALYALVIWDSKGAPVPSYEPIYGRTTLAPGQRFRAGMALRFGE
ncbi:MAG: hypothetical protein J0L75_06560 [Spirochaetes bacterium]|nr:hypothetical protein [Spirochaetota bacterium]